MFDVAEKGSTEAPVRCQDVSRENLRLCATWEDPDYQPQHNAFYYARVLEAPSCRWTQHFCESQAVSCSNEDLSEDVKKLCCNPDLPKHIQERAWSSPIWIQPSNGD